MIKKYKVYIMGPMLSSGNPWRNVHNGAMLAHDVLRRGHIPFLPHINSLWSMICPHTESEMLEWDQAWLDLCDCGIRLAGKSDGADKEEARLLAQNKPVFFSITAFVSWTIEQGRLNDIQTTAAAGRKQDLG